MSENSRLQQAIKRFKPIRIKTESVIVMAKCPNCKKENPKPAKTWKYGQFKVQAYTCNHCKTQYREYLGKNGKHKFTLKLQKGKGYKKV